MTAALDRGIKRLGEHDDEVQRQAIDALLGDMALLSRSVRVAPEVRDGQPVGFRLLSVSADGPFGRIGLRDGDVTSSINALEIATSDWALEAYTKVWSASHLSVGLERNGRRINQEYSVR